MSSIQSRAVMVKKYSHVVFTRIRLNAPEGTITPGKWAEAQIGQWFEDLATDNVEPLMFLSAMQLYPGTSYAHSCQLRALEKAVKWLNDGLGVFLHDSGEDRSSWGALPPKGAVAIDVRTVVPREKRTKLVAGVTLYANDEKVDTVSRAVAATNPEMIVQLALGLQDVFAKASKSSAITGGAPVIGA